MFLEDIKNQIYYLTNEKTKNWYQLLKFSETLDINEKRKYCWAWPTADNLLEINKLLNNTQINRIVSIGCGNGLLEWILKERIGIEIFGLEVDRKWWESQYAIQKFIPLKYFEDLPVISNELLFQQICGTDNWNFALLFCYFNNHTAFINYMKLYKGKWLIIIGPDPRSGLHTEPNPLEPSFLDDEVECWMLKTKILMPNFNLFVLYERVK